MRNFKKDEKRMIALIWNENYNAYICPVHGIFINRKDNDKGNCPYPYTCDAVCTPIENVKELHKQFRKELGL